MRVRPSTLREWIVVAFAATGVALLPWTVWLSQSLSAHHETTDWNLAWSGFDTGLALLFVVTAVAAYRRSPWVGALAAALGTLLLVDAWFDIVLDSHWDERRYAILLAALAELPAAAACFWVARRAERIHAWAVEEALELAPPGERAPEGDLVRVLEVAADGEAAREPRDADSAA
jgi:hypothetical protein